MQTPVQFCIYAVDPGPAVCHGVEINFAGGLAFFSFYHSYAPDLFVKAVQPHPKAIFFIEMPEAIYRPAAGGNLLLTAKAAGVVGGQAACNGFTPLTYVKPNNWRATLGVLKGNRKASAVDAKIKAFCLAHVQNVPTNLPVHAYDAMGLALAQGIIRRYFIPGGWKLTNASFKATRTGRKGSNPQGRPAQSQTRRGGRKGRRGHR